jgi:hypothetical protein
VSLFPDEIFGKEVKTKYCRKCGRDLPLSCFGKASGANYLYYECKECTRKHNKVRKLLKEQNPLKDPNKHICPICKRNHDEVLGSGGMHLKSGWVMDHDHITGEYRGYICHSCNRGIGMFQDNIEIMNRAINYLKGDLVD